MLFRGLYAVCAVCYMRTRTVCKRILHPLAKRECVPFRGCCSSYSRLTPTRKTLPITKIIKNK